MILCIPFCPSAKKTYHHDVIISFLKHSVYVLSVPKIHEEYRSSCIASQFFILGLAAREKTPKILSRRFEISDSSVLEKLLVFVL